MRVLSPIDFSIRMFAMTGLALALVWTYVGVAKLAFLPGGYPSWLAKMSIMSECKAGGIDFFGNSRVEAGIKSDVIGPEINNLGVAGGSPIEIAAGVKRVLTCPDKPVMVVIGVDAMQFVSVNRDFWVESIGYGFIRPTDILDMEHEAARLDDRTTLWEAKTSDGLSGWVRDWFYAAQFPSIYFANLVKGQIFRRYGENKIRYKQILRARGFVPYPVLPATNDPGPEGLAKSFVHTPLQTAMFRQTLSILQNSDIPVVLFMMPVKRSIYDGMAPATRAAFFAYLHDLTESFHNIRLASYDIPVWPGTMFTDNVHLNQIGADQFSRLLATCFLGTTFKTPCVLSYVPVVAAKVE